MKTGTTKRGGNAGVGYGYLFHGAFGKKADAVKKESSTPGAFIKFTPTRGGRYVVMSPRTNPPKKRKSKAKTPRRVKARKGNVGELVVLGLNNPKGKKAKRGKKNVEFGEFNKGVFHPWTRRPKSRKKPAKRKLKKNAFSPLASAKGLFKKFHGKDFNKVLEMNRSAHARKDYAALGALVAVGIDGPRFDELRPSPDQVVNQWDKLPHLRFGVEDALLAASPDGKQLYILGPDQEIDVSKFDTDTSKDFVDLGEATYIVYSARKAPSFEPTDWVHTFGEEGGVRPRLVYSRLAKELLFVGGSYHIDAPGIIN